MTRAIDLTGQRFGRLVVEGLESRAPTKNRRWICRCDCGTRRKILGTSLRGGMTHSCGCLRRELGVDKARHMREALARSQSRFQRLRGAVEGLFAPSTAARRDDAGPAVRVVRGWRY